MVNPSVDDISRYNSNIATYNIWLDNNGQTNNLHLDVYKTNKKYIDYNNDGEYSSREEVTTMTPATKGADTNQEKKE